MVRHLNFRHVFTEKTESSSKFTTESPTENAKPHTICTVLQNLNYIEPQSIFLHLYSAMHV